MPYHITWLVPDRVLLTTFKGNISKAELSSFILEITDAIMGGTPLMYHISDSRQMGKVEVSLQGLQEIVKAFPLFNNLGWQIDINQPSLNRMIAAIASQFVRVNARMVTSLEEAISFIQQIDITLASAVWSLPHLADVEAALATQNNKLSVS